MEKRGPIFEKSRSVENVYHMRLTALLRGGGFKEVTWWAGWKHREGALARGWPPETYPLRVNNQEH